MTEAAERDEGVASARQKPPVVEPVPVKKTTKKRVPGMFKSEFELGSAFFEPLPPEELARWDRTSAPV